MNRETLIEDLNFFNQKYRSQGFVLVSLFGSYARGEEDIFSDIDLTYEIDHNVFYKNDAFAKLQKIKDIKKELEKEFHKKIDLIPANSTNYLIKETLEKEQINI